MRVLIVNTSENIGGAAVAANRMMNALNRIIINDQAHENFYKKFGEKQYIKRYH